MWLILSLIGYIALAGVFVLDKFILTKSVDTPIVYTFYSTIFMVGALLAWPFGVELLVGVDWLWAVVSGVGFGFGMWAMFIAVKAGEASHVNPFIGASITIATFALASVFLGETLTAVQIVGMVFLAGSTLLLSCFNEKGLIGFNRSYAWGILAAVLFAISHTTAKYLYEVYPFLTGFVWTRATTGLVGLFVLCFPAVWRSFHKKSTTRVASTRRLHATLIVVGDKLLSIVGVVMIQLAIALGSVTLVNALVGVQYALMFGIIFLLTRFKPRLFQERFSTREVVVETIAIVCVIAGSALFVL